MITEDYVSFEVAKLLKEKGFSNDFCQKWYNIDETEPFPCPVGFKGCLPAPTLQMAMKWLRKTHNLFVEIFSGENDGKFWYDFDIIPVNGKNIEWDYYENIPTEEYSSPEEACEAAIKYCLENLI